MALRNNWPRLFLHTISNYVHCHNQGSVCKSAFSTNTQSRFASCVFDGVLGTPRVAQHTWRCPCISVVPEATHEASRGPEKGAVSAQKALRGSETETRELLGGTEENSVSPMRGHWFALQANQWVFTKRKQKKNWVSGQTWTVPGFGEEPLPQNVHGRRFRHWRGVMRKVHWQCSD